jgi:DNA-directed RNA polymerase specialized sigma24 family protein
MAKATAIDWSQLAELLRRMMLARRQLECDAEDFASEAIAVTLAWLGGSTQPERRIWSYAITTCRKRLASAIRDPRNTLHSIGSFDEFTDDRNPDRGRDDGERLAKAELEALAQNLKGTARRVLRLLQEWPHTNVELATRLGVTVRAVEMARQTIRARGDGILASSFGVDPPSCRRRSRRTRGREAEQGGQGC